MGLNMKSPLHKRCIKNTRKRADMNCSNKSITVRGRQLWVMVAAQTPLEVQVAICGKFQFDFIYKPTF